MYILGLIVCVFLIILSFKNTYKCLKELSSFCKYLASAVVCITSLTIALCCCFGIITTFNDCVELKYIDNKIVMYEEENKKIENDVELIVKDYMQHENKTFDMGKIESPTTLVQMYPELKSNTLVGKQIDIFNENNKQIKKLKLKQIECEKAKFLLYFGG